MKILIARWRASNLIIIGLSTLVALAAFGLAALPAHSVRTDLASYTGGQVEQASEFTYIWTTPNLKLIYRDLPRFTPINLKFSAILDRPEGAPDAWLEIFESRNNILTPLVRLYYVPGKSGLQEYNIKIPAVAGDNSDELILNFKSNGFRVPGDPRELGVRLSQVELSASKSGWLLALLPYFLAVAGLLLGLAWWCALLDFSPFEAVMLLAPTGFMAGAMANLLVYSIVWQFLTALWLLASAWFWQRRGAARLAAADALAWKTLAWVLAPIAGLGGFFVLAPGLAGDIFYFREVLAPMLQYGPVGVYPKDPRLNYPPGAVFQLWFYGVLTRPFNVQYNQTPLKLLMGTSLLVIFPTIWLMGRRSGVNAQHLARTVFLFGGCLSMLFLPAVWVQADGWLLWLMALALLLVIWRRPYLSATTQAIAVIYKAQSWLLLPLYALTFQWRMGWRKAWLGAGWCTALIVGLGGLGFAYDPEVFKVFWNQPVISGESDWGGIRTFNLMHLLGYDRIKVPQPLLSLSYLAVGLMYLAVLLVCWRRNALIRGETAEGSPERAARLGLEWFLAAAFILTFIFFFWVKMHERYLYFGLGFLLLAALYRRVLYRPALFMNLLFSLNLLYAYLPERRDPIPNNFFLWRHLLNPDFNRAILCLLGLALCGWLAWLYFRPAPTIPPATSSNNYEPAETGPSLNALSIKSLH